MSVLISCDGPDGSLNFSFTQNSKRSHLPDPWQQQSVTGRTACDGRLLMDNVEGQDLASMVPIGTMVIILP